MNEPWKEFPEIWSTQSAFFTWLRSGLRRAVWEKYPPKLKFKNEQAYKPDESYTGKAKKLVKCALTGEELAVSKSEIDHIEGHVSLRNWEDVLPFIQHLCASKDNMQVVSKEAHRIKSYAERMGIPFEEAYVEKKAIEICKKKLDKQFIEDAGLVPATNQTKRREQVRDILNAIRNST